MQALRLATRVKFLVGYSGSYQAGRSHQPFRIGGRLMADSFAKLSIGQIRQLDLQFFAAQD